VDYPLLTYINHASSCSSSSPNSFIFFIQLHCFTIIRDHLLCSPQIEVTPSPLLLHFLPSRQPHSRASPRAAVALPTRPELPPFFPSEAAALPRAAQCCPPRFPSPIPGPLLLHPAALLCTVDQRIAVAICKCNSSSSSAKSRRRQVLCRR
jgi:hypothetical protein